MSFTPPVFGPKRWLNDDLTVRAVTIEVTRTKELSTTLTYDLYYITGDAGLPRLVEFMERVDRFGLDLETSDLKPWKGQIATLQIGNPLGSEPQAWVIDLRCCSRAALAPVFAHLRSSKKRKIGQNIGFEASWLQYHCGVRLRNVADTQIAEQVVRSGLFEAKSYRDGGGGGEKAAYKYSSMAWMAQFYLGIELDKDFNLRTGFYKTAPGQHDNRQLAYAAGDVIYPFYMAACQLPLLKERGLTPIVAIEFGLVPVLADATLTGMMLDQPAWRALWQEALQKRADAEKLLDEMIRPATLQSDMFDTAARKERPIFPKTNTPLNYDSSQQVAWVITEYCKHAGWHLEIVTKPARWLDLKKTWGDDWLQKRVARNAQLREAGRASEIKDVEAKDIPDHVVPWHVACSLVKLDKGKLKCSTDKDTLKLRMARKQLPAELVKALLTYGMYSIRADTFGNEFIKKHVHADSRVHTDFNQCITTTGRLSASPNTMNIPKDKRYRACFIAGKGKKLFLADFSQIEPRLSAEVSDDFVYTTAFIEGKDIYVQVAEAMFQQAVDKHTPEGALLRAFAKVLVLGLAYRMGPWKLMDTITLAMLNDILDGKVPLPTYDEVLKMYNRFFDECGGIREYQDAQSAIADHAKSTRKEWDDFIGGPITYVVAPCGRRRHFDDGALAVFTEGPNAPIQGCSATITKAACVYFQAELDARGWEERCHIINIVHDEIVGEADDEIVEECARLLKECMERAGRQYVKKVPVIAEFPEGTTGVVNFWTK